MHSEREIGAPYECKCGDNCSPGKSGAMICSNYQKQYLANNDPNIIEEDKQVKRIAYLNAASKNTYPDPQRQFMARKILEVQAENKKLVFLLGTADTGPRVSSGDISATIYNLLHILLSNYKTLQEAQIGSNPLPMQTFSFNIGNVNNHSFAFVCNTNGESAIFNGLGSYGPEQQAVLEGFDRAFHEVFGNNKKLSPTQIISPDQDRKYRQKENTCRIGSAMVLAKIDPNKPLKEQKLDEQFAAIQAKPEETLRAEFTAACNNPNRPAVQDEKAPEPIPVVSAAPVAMHVDNPAPVSLASLETMFNGKLAHHQCNVSKAGAGLLVQQARYREVNHDNVYGKHNLCVIEDNQLKACQPKPDVIELFMMFKLANELWPGKKIQVENCHSQEMLQTMQLAKRLFVNYMQNSPDVAVKKDVSGLIKLPGAVNEAASEHTATQKTTLKIR